MSIQVNDFRWEPGKNDAEYIRLLESSRYEWERIAKKAIAKLRTLSKAQEPVKPLKMEVEHVRKEPVVFSYQCPVCMCGLQRHWVACPICGTGVKWE